MGIKSSNTGIAMIKLFMLLASTLISPVHAEERITPTCWEEQIKGEVFRHCEVNRAPKPALIPVRPQTALPPPTSPQTAYEPTPQRWPLPPPPPAYAVDRIPHYGPVYTAKATTGRWYSALVRSVS
jgi:hypothetical protein